VTLGRRHPARTRRNGWALLDLVIGLSMLTLLAGFIAVAANHQAKARGRLAEQRAAVYLAESALLAVRSHDGPAKAELPQGAAVDVLDAKAPEGQVWVRVTARYGSAEASLIGLVPEGGAP